MPAGTFMADEKDRNNPPAGGDMSFEEWSEKLDAAADGEESQDEDGSLSLWDRLKQGFSMKELGRSLVRGATSAPLETASTVADVADVTKKNLPLTTLDVGLAVARRLPIRKTVKKALAERDAVVGERSKNIVAGFAEDVSQFITGMAMLGGTGAVGQQAAAKLGGKKLAQTVAAGSVKGAAVDFAAFDPTQEGLAELAARAPEGFRGAYLKELGTALTPDSDDGAMAARLKRASVGVVPGVILDGLVEGIRFKRARSILTSESTTPAQKAKAAETLGESQETLTNIAAGLHTPEDAHVVVRPTDDGKWELRSVEEDIPEARPAKPSPQPKEPLARKIAQKLDPQAYEERRTALRAAETDALTGLANRAAFDKALPSAEADPETVIIRFDVNGFKGVNDKLPGKHAAGDEALKSIAAKIKEAASKYGVGERVFRVGGDEFAVIAPKGKAAQIRKLAEQGYGSVEHAPGVKSSISGGIGETDKAADEVTGARKQLHKAEQGFVDERTGQPFERPTEMPAEPVVERPTFASRGEAEAQAATINRAMEEHLGAARQAGGLQPDQAAQVRDTFKRMLEAPTEDDLQKLIEGTHFNFAYYAAEPEQTRALIESISEVFEKEIDEAQGRVSDVEMMRKARALIRGIPENQLAPAFVKAIRNGGLSRGSLSSKLLAADFVLREFGQKIAGMFDALDARPHDAVAHEEARLALGNYLELQRTVAEGWSESGRTLRTAQLRDQFAGRMRELDAKKAARDAAKEGAQEATPQVPVAVPRGADLVAGMSHREVRGAVRLLKMANGEPRAVFDFEKAVRIMHDTKSLSKAVEFFVNALLSGFGTPIVNVTSGVGMSVVEASSRIVGGLATANKAMAREGADILWGNFRYLAENVKAAGVALREGRSIINPVPQTHSIGGVTGRIVRTPTRILTALDEFVRVTNYRSYVRAKSLRHWREQGLEGSALLNRVETDLKLAFDPQTGVATIPEGLRYAEVPTLSAPLGLDTPGGRLHKYSSTASEAKFVMPFVKVSVNVFRYAWDSTPVLNLFNQRAREILRSGGEEAASLHARSAFAATLYGTGWYLASQGQLTGRGPSDKNLRALWLQNHKPYSIKVGNEWYSYRRMEPFATFLGLVSDIKTMEEEGFETEGIDLATATVAGLSANLAAKTYMVGLTDFMDAFVSGDPRETRSYLSRLATALAVPQAIAQFNQDDYLREVRGYSDALIARVPGFSDELPPRYNYLGEPIQGDPKGFLGTNRLFNPVRLRGEAGNDEVSEALLKLHKGFSPASRKVSDGTLDLASKEWNGPDGQTPWDRYQEILREGRWNGKPLRDRLADLVQSSKWQRASEGSEEFPGGERWLMAAAEINGYRKKAMAAVRKEFPKLHEAMKQHERMKAASLRDGQAGFDRLKQLANK